MKASFRIEYRTAWGESLALEIGGRRYPMLWNEGGIWTVTVPGLKEKDLESYGYIVLEDGLVKRSEWEPHHRPAGKVKTATGAAETAEGTGKAAETAGKAAAGDAGDAGKEPAGTGKARGAAEEICDGWIDCPMEGCMFPRKHQAEVFDKPGFRGAGTAVPVFSLRTEKDFGIGEFRDLRPLVDWAAGTGQCIIQLLPINDTTRKGGWEDSYPYAPVSAFALNPLYIHLQDLGIEEDEDFRREQHHLNSLKELDYPAVFKAKTAYLKKAYRTQRDTTKPAFKRFVKENEAWLQKYSEFCAGRDGDEPLYHCWVQYHLDRQLSEEVAYARSKGIHLKGDLPIGVSADSADAFYHPELFNLDCTAGAPPDFFSRDGQNWGFPTYNWDAMARDDYAWWKARLRKMGQWFDAFRIDHILGFFRIWEIPAGVKSGMAGYFNPALPYTEEEIRANGLPLEGLFHGDPRHPGMFQPLITPDDRALDSGQHERFGAMYNDFFFHRHDAFWRREALRKLPALLNATGMLACGEDLGMVPDCVPGVMEGMAILSLKMRGMENEGQWKRLSVCATSSHDIQTLRMQCPSDPEPWECRKMLWDFLSSPSMLAIFPLQDWLSMDGTLRRPERGEERINEPADPHHHWRYRVHFPLENLASARDLNFQVESLIKDSRRYSSAKSM